MADKNERLRFLDIARGISIICIILGHLGVYSIERVVFTFHVPIFYFITGYFTSDALPAAAFIRKKARTLLVPYAFTCILMIVGGTLEGIILGSGWDAFRGWLGAALYGAGDSYTSPFPIKAIGAIWFLWACFWGSILLRLSLGMRSWLRPLFIGFVFWLSQVSRNLFWFPLSIQAGACSALFMYLGWLLKRAPLKSLPRMVKAAGLLAAFALWAAFIANYRPFLLVNAEVGRGMTDIIGCICGCIIVVWLSWLLDRSGWQTAKLLAHIGEHSLMVLCIHILELNLFPWFAIARKLVSFGMPDGLSLPFIIAGKLISVFIVLQIALRLQPVRKVFFPKK